MKAVVLLGVVLAIGFLFGWTGVIIGVIGGVIYLVFKAATHRAEPTTSTIVAVDRDARGNRYMAGDPLDAPMNSTDDERHAIVRHIQALNPQMDPLLLSFRQRALNDPGYLTTEEGIEAVNGIGAGMYEGVSHMVSGWNTNDFRRLGLEVMTARHPEGAY
jgi:hypothetical protein